MSKKRRKKLEAARTDRASLAVAAARESDPLAPDAVSPTRRNLTLYGISLAVLTILIYLPLRGHPFVSYDDGIYITANPYVQEGLTWKTVTWAFTRFYDANWHPLTWLLHSVNYKLFGMNAGGHHVASLLLHLFNVVLLFMLLARITGAAGRSAFVAALFAVHPLNVESVAWAAELKNVLCTFFFLLALGAYGWYALKPSVKRYVLVAFVFLLGLASKPMVVTLPFVLLLLDFWPLGRILRWTQPSPAFPVQQRSFWALALEKLPLLALSVSSGLITIAAQRSVHASEMVSATFSTRFGNALDSYGLYLWKALWPSGLAPFYPYPSAPFAAWRLALVGLFLIIVSAFVWRARGKEPYLITGWLWYIGTLVPVIGLVQVGGQSWANRYAYIPLVGIFVLIVWQLADFADAWRLSREPRIAFASLVLAGLSILTVRQDTFWESSYQLWTHTLAVTVDNPVAEHNLAMELLATHRWDEATPHLMKASELTPADPVILADLGVVLSAQGRDQEAIKKFETAIQHSSDPQMLSTVHQYLGTEYFKVGADAQAELNYRKALGINPRQSGAMQGLGMVLMNRRLGEMSQSLTAHPTPNGFLRLGLMFQQANRVEEARGAYEKALKLDPSLEEARKALDALSTPPHGR